MGKIVIQTLHSLGIDIPIIIAAIIAGMIKVDNKLPLMKKVAFILVAAFISNYCTPVLIGIFHLDASLSSGLGFIIGYLNLDAIRFIENKLKSKLSKKIDAIEEEVETEDKIN
jgi:hypothetical protein